MRQRIGDDERRARLGRRHQLASGFDATTPLEVANALTAVHGTDPGSTVLGILARSPTSTIADVDSAMYETRTIVRVLGMRRTVFAVDYRMAPSIWSSFETTVARTQRRLLEQALERAGVSNIASHIHESEGRLLAFLEENPGSTSAQISADDDLLSVRLIVGGNAAAGAPRSVASQLLTLMSAEGRVIRARPKGGWTSSQFTWAVTDQWRADWPERPAAESADAAIAASYLAGHGPATIDDLAWWTGWPKGRSQRAIGTAQAIEVETVEGAAFVLSTDRAPVDPVDEWVALLPGLDSSTMGWKRRGFYLGSYADRVFDTVGNAGPTVWVNGRVVGGWAQRASGEVAFETFEDIGRDASHAVAQTAARLSERIGDVRLKPRARGYTASERALA